MKQKEETKKGYEVKEILTKMPIANRSYNAFIYGWSELDVNISGVYRSSENGYVLMYNYSMTSEMSIDEASSRLTNYKDELMNSVKRENLEMFGSYDIPYWMNGESK